MDDNTEPDKPMMILKIIWFAMLFSLAVYMFLGNIIENSIKPSIDENAFNILKTVLYIIAILLLVAARFVRKAVISGNVNAWPPKQGIAQSAFQRYSIATIISLAMSESAGIFGLVLFLIGKSSMDLYLLIFISAAAMFIYRPRKEEIDGYDAKKMIKKRQHAG